MAEMIDEKAIINAIIGLLATGGSTNHTLHLVAMAKAAGVLINWDDFSDLSDVIPLLARVYPNGSADVNHFHAAGGMGFLIRELLDAGLLHGDVNTVMGHGLHHFAQEPFFTDGGLIWRDAPIKSGDETVLRPANNPFSSDGGLKLLKGNMGRSVMKTSSVAAEHRVVTAPALVFDDQLDVVRAFKQGKLERDFVAVVRYQGPRANGMPELHQLTPALSSLQNRGFKVALVTDGRMSGASGTVPAAIHITPECFNNGPLRHVRDGDIIHLDSNRGILEARVPSEVWLARHEAMPDLSHNGYGMGRELFGSFRGIACDAEAGASSFGPGF
jgi:phosphogluconate dehydratase